MSFPHTFFHAPTQRQWLLLPQAAMLIALLLSPYRVMAGNDLEFTVKSAYTYNFIQFIDWQEQKINGAPGPVKICMIGNKQFGAALAQLSNRQVKGRSIQVEQDTPENVALTTCHVVVIDRSAEDQLPRIFSQLAGANVLTVSDIPHFAQKGGGIGFVLNEGKVKIEINPQATQQAGLKVSAKLLEVARIIQ